MFTVHQVPEMFTMRQLSISLHQTVTHTHTHTQQATAFDYLTQRERGTKLMIFTSTNAKRQEPSSQTKPQSTLGSGVAELDHTHCFQLLHCQDMLHTICSYKHHCMRTYYRLLRFVVYLRIPTLSRCVQLKFDY